MLWENRENAGFTAPGVATWLPLVWDWPSFTVETETADPGTMLKLYRKLLSLRRDLPALHAGDVSGVSAEDGVLRYTRSAAGQTVQVLLSFTDQPRTASAVSGTILLTSFLDREGEAVAGATSLRPGEALLISTSNKTGLSL